MTSISLTHDIRLYPTTRGRASFVAHCIICQWAIFAPTINQAIRNIERHKR